MGLLAGMLVLAAVVEIFSSGHGEDIYLTLWFFSLIGKHHKKSCLSHTRLGLEGPNAHSSRKTSDFLSFCLKVLG